MCDENSTASPKLMGELGEHVRLAFDCFLQAHVELGEAHEQRASDGGAARSAHRGVVVEKIWSKSRGDAGGVQQEIGRPCTGYYRQP
jgi:hypothetical protein